MYGNVAIKVAVGKNLVAVEDPQVAVVIGGGGSEGLPGPDNTADRISYTYLATISGKRRHDAFQVEYIEKVFREPPLVKVEYIEKVFREPPLVFDIRRW
jgi:hypothetical protein